MSLEVVLAPVICSDTPVAVWQYLVKRRGLDLTQYGKVDARAAKRQRFEGVTGDKGSAGSSSSMPVLLEMVDEYEGFTSKFWSSVHDHTEDGDLDLGAPLPPRAGLSCSCCLVFHSCCCLHYWRCCCCCCGMVPH
jgi:hypothetical protein